MSADTAPPGTPTREWSPWSGQPRICPECVAPDEDPLPWCECADSTDTCTGPCRQRAHDPTSCPVRPGHLTKIVDLEDKINDRELAITRLEAALADAIRAAGVGVDPADVHADCWVPVPLYWAHIVPGDVIVGGGDSPTLWAVTTVVHAEGATGTVVADAVHGARPFTKEAAPDATASVLARHGEREALVLARAELGAKIMERQES